MVQNQKLKTGRKPPESGGQGGQCLTTLRPGAPRRAGSAGSPSLLIPRAGAPRGQEPGKHAPRWTHATSPPWLVFGEAEKERGQKEPWEVAEASGEGEFAKQAATGLSSDAVSP